MAIINGSENNDTLNGTASADTIRGFGGRDIIDAGGGNDIVYGGAGNDTITDLAGATTELYGEDGDDSFGISVTMSGIIDGGDGFDRLSTLAAVNLSNLSLVSIERLYTNGVRVTATAEQFEAFERISYGSTNTTSLVTLILSAPGTMDLSDQLLSTPAKIEGSAGNDWIKSGSGNDILYGLGGNDTIYGGAGNDEIGSPYAGEETGDNFYYGEDGNDVLHGGEGNDYLDGGAGGDLLVGRGGNDILIGGAGSDFLVDDPGLLNMSAGSGDDGLFLSGTLEDPPSPTGLVDGGAGNDYLKNETSRNLDISSLDIVGVEGLYTGYSVSADQYGYVFEYDTVTGTAEQFEAFDYIAAGVAFDTTGHANPPVWRDVLGPHLALSAPGVLDLSDELGNLDGTITGSSGNDVITSGRGNDTLNGGAGDDVLNGGEGDDSLNGGAGTDAAYGGAGNDTLYFDGAGAEVVDGGDGFDAMVPNIPDTDISQYTITGVEALYTSGGTVTATAQQLASFQVIGYLPDQPTMAPSLRLAAPGSVDLSGTFGNRDVMIYGSDGNDVITTGSGNDLISGGAGDDYVISNAGDDHLNGHAGDDYLAAWIGNDLVYGGTGNDQIFGESGNDELYGEDGNDQLLGGADNDFLDGGSGNDVLDGGSGNDYYVIDSLGDTIVEAAGGGIDTVRTTALTAYTLGAEVENLIYMGSSNFTGTGNALANVLTGGDGNDELKGLGGDDTLIGGYGNDSLSGGAGNDILNGGLGDDTYIIDSAGDVILDSGGWDTARVYMSTYTLTADVEDLIYIGSGSFTGEGTLADNLIKGGALNDTLNGLGGNDTLQGGAGNDTLFGGEDDDNLQGGSGNDILDGSLGNDTLDGGTGDDMLVGGAGDDKYIVDSTGDVVQEVAGGGVDTIVTTLANYSLASLPEVENLTYSGTGSFTGTGNAQSNTLIAGAGNDTLFGGDGDDSLNGGVGNDTMVGGAGNDSYQVDSSGDVVTELAGGGVDMLYTSLTAYTLGAEVEQLYYSGYWGAPSAAFAGTGNAKDNVVGGGSAKDDLKGLGGNDYLYAGNGNDTLNGGTGNDTMFGGVGDDTYILDSIDDVIIEEAGMDTARVYMGSYTLTADVENLIYIGSATFTGTGNQAANLIKGGALNDTLYGLGGDDTLQGGSGDDALDGGAGHDTLEGGSGNDTLYGGGHNDTLYGGTGNDRLEGGDGDDTLDGGTGYDTLVGGAGNDTYYVETNFDVVTEVAGGGTDTIVTGLSSYTLKAEVETLVYNGTGSFAGTGNALANVLFAGGGNDTLLGLAGNDTLFGNGGDDWLDGGVGNDILYGGAGNDTYVVETNNDIITELAGEGTDTVRTALSSYTLKAEVENLTYTGTAAFKGTGTDDANVITGGIGADKLYGLGGADTLIGGAGKDSLYGGAGADTFVYTSAADTTVADYDYIADFSAAEGDIIDLSAIDANVVGGTSDDAFVYVGSAAFSGTAGELRFSGGMLQGDTDGDGIADLAIKLSGTSSLDAASLRL